MNIKPKKSLGQNFLKNKDIVRKIVAAANLSAEDVVLEVGPGKGVLTEELAKIAGKVVAVEIDGNLVKILRDKFKGNEKVEIVEGDILKNNVAKLISKFPLPDSEAESACSQREKGAGSEGKLDAKYKLIANIPYYITSPIIRFFLENKFPPKEMILMVQKEVAERIVAEPGQHSILSLSVQYYANPELLFYVSKNDFDPVPEVDSAVIKISWNMEQVTYSKTDSDNFFRIVRAGFCAKRKTLANNLANSFHLDKKEVEEKLKIAGISGIARAQELSKEDWKKLVKIFL
jgi:16S rRNA (adenine1518-N6/adenine1519-N6)-dimethyltransferase